MSQQFCLKWNSHMTNMMDVFKSLLSTESMVDCTLACDGLSLKAHKIVLSACSPFFQALFLENPCKHPIVILKDMKYTELKAIIEFMYHGEVNVGQDQLSALMKTAETLRVKGLAEVTNEKNSQSNASGDEPSHRSVPRTETPPPSKRRRRTRKRSLSDSNRSDDESNEPKVKQPMSPDIEELSGDHTMEATSGHFSSIQSQVPMQQMPSHSTNSFQRTNVAQDSPHVEEPTSADESEFGVEPAKLLEQTLTTDDLANARRGRSSAQSSMEMQRRSRSTDHSTSLVPTSMPSDSYSSSMNQQLESPPDIKPELLDLDPPISPVPGPSHSADNSMMFDQSSVSSHPGTSFQDNSGALVPQDSSPQGRNKIRNQQSSSRICGQFTCLVCPYSSNNKEDIRQHVQFHSDGKTNSLPKRNQKRYSCNYCSFKSYSQHAITQHSRSHPDFRYSCYSCKQSFHLKNELTEHLKTHKSSEVYKCDICSQEFTLINVLTYHRKSHIQSKSFTCQYCQKVFCDVVVFNQHIKLHQDTDSKVKVKKK